MKTMKSFFGRLACRLGRHDWRYWHMSISYIRTFPTEVSVERTCLRCSEMESADDNGDGTHNGKWKRCV